MNIQQVQYILAVAELKNFGKAADKCCITQSTLSTMIGKFENETGIQVFDRKTKPVSVTQEGKVLIRQLRHISNEINALEELVQMLKGEMSGELKIGIIPTVAPFILPRFLNDFAKKFPQISFSVSEITTLHITDALLKRELDIGILAVPLQISGIREIPLYEEPFVLYNCSNMKMGRYANIEKVDFDKFWLLEEGHCISTQVQRICDFDSCDQKEHINFDYRAGSIDSLIRFVKVNNGITMLPYLAALDFDKEDMGRVVYFEKPTPVRSIALVTHKNFVKERILNLLKVEIQDKILPLLKSQRKGSVVAPI